MTAEPSTDIQLANPVGIQDVMSQQAEFPFFSIHATGISILPECPEEDWRTLAKACASAFENSGLTHCRMMAKLADVLNFGFAVYGERASDVVDATAGFMRLHAKTLDHAMSCFLKIPEERRRVDELTFEHHKAVQKLVPEEQTEFLDLAISEGMTVSALKEAIKERHPKNTAATKKKKASTDKSITKKECLAAVQTIEDFFIQMEEEHGSAGIWTAEMKADFIQPFRDLNKICRRVAIPSHGGTAKKGGN